MKRLGLISFSLLCAISIQAQWIKMNDFNNALINGITFKNSNIYVCTDSEGVLYRSTNNGEDWALANDGLPKKPINSITIDGPSLFVTTSGGGVYISTNGGDKWTSANIGLTNLFVTPLVITSNKIFVGTNEGVFLSTDKGATWSARNIGLRNTIISLVVSGSKLFAATFLNGLFVSLDDGTTWSEVDTTFTGTWIGPMIAKDLHIFVSVFGKGITCSIDDGINWKWVNSGLSDSMITSLFVLDTAIIAGSGWDDRGNIFSSSENVILWKEINYGLPNKCVLSLASNNVYLLAGTWGGGLWRRLISEITSGQEIDLGIPQNFTLSQNFPNPFNPSTVISYQLPVMSKVTLKIYDLLGREIATLVNEEQTAGWKEIEWNASSVASGIYFYKLQANNFVETKKMLIIK